MFYSRMLLRFSILTSGPIIYTEHKISPIDESEPLF